MRSRYTAYARHAIDYLHATSGPAVRKEFDAAATRKWAESATWDGLEILGTEGGGEADAEGTVEFLARYTINGSICNHREIASFRRTDGRWIFEDGRVIGPDPVRREAPKIGRNDPCPCGSGRKFKKCCVAKSGA
jgi:SEC-C motif domain protein